MMSLNQGLWDQRSERTGKSRIARQHYVKTAQARIAEQRPEKTAQARMLSADCSIIEGGSNAQRTSINQGLQGATLRRYNSINQGRQEQCSEKTAQSRVA
jgi:putative N-acetylmannosamine-6-phosphate epimerase